MSPIFSHSDLSKHLHKVGGDDLVEDSETNAESRADRTRELLLQAMAADADQREALHEEIILLNVDIAESIVMRYRNRGVAVEDLVQVACLGLVKAARGFDPTKSDNFLGYAVPTILGEVKRFFRDNAWVVRPPRRIQELQAQISAVSSEIMQASGQVPTAREIADALGVDDKDVSEALSADGCFSPSSLDRPPGDGEVNPLSEVIGDVDPGFNHAEAVVALRPLCRNLSERDRRIVYLRFFHEWTQAKIAEEFGVTQMQVSRLLSRILRELREQIGQVEPTCDDETQRQPESVSA